MELGGKCKSLRTLFIQATRITEKGIISALNNLPHLKILDHPHVFRALAEMHRNQQQPLPKYGLNNLWFAMKHCQLLDRVIGPCRGDDLGLAASACPLVTKVVLCFAERDNIITDRELLGLLAFEKLNELTLMWETNDNNSRFTFNGSLATVLKARGMSLQYLKMYVNSIEVDVDFLLEFCPNLKYLELGCRFTSRDDPHNPKRTKRETRVFEQLETLRIQSEDSENLIGLLSAAPAVTHLVFRNCLNLTDDVLQKVFEFHSFTSLKELEFYMLHSLTDKGIDLFMNERNALEKIKLEYCDTVTPEKVRGWRNNAEKNNWNLTIDVSMFITLRPTLRPLRRIN